MTNMLRVRRGVSAAIFAFLAGAYSFVGFGGTDVQAQGMTLDICPSDYGSFLRTRPRSVAVAPPRR
jgi:hypothetical protein